MRRTLTFLSGGSRAGAPGGLRRWVGVALLASLLAGAPPLPAKDPPPAPPRHVIVLALGGGVRARDVLDLPRHPAVKALIQEGVLVESVVSPRSNAWLAARDLVTGRGDEPDQEGRSRPAQPTLFEHVRTALNLAPEHVWYCCGVAGDDALLAASSHASFGPSVGARVASGLGALGEPLSEILEDLGRPLPVPEPVWPLLRRLRALNRATAGAFLPDEVTAGTPEAERVERAVLEELDRKALLVKAPSVSDERALRAALTVLAVHRPTLLWVRLTGAEVAQSSVERYREVLAAADRGIERLRAAVAQDPQLAGSTTLVLTTETGRNEKLNERGGLDADDASGDRRHAVTLFVGPGLRPGAKVKGPRALVDVAPTVARLLGTVLPGTTGRVWEELLRLP